MAGEWTETTLGQVLAFQRGHDLPADARVVGSVPVIGSAGFTGWHNEARAKGPGLTIGRSGASAGVISFVERDYWPHNTCLYITDFGQNDPKFCFYWLGCLDIPRFNVGSAQPSLNRNHLYPLPVRLPEPREQRAIAATLSSLDDKIAINRRMTETLQAIARTLFQSWFVDFEPVRRAMAGQDPGLPYPLAILFPTYLTQEGLPQGWVSKPLSGMATTSRDTVEPASLGDGAVLHLSLPAFDKGQKPILEPASAVKSLKTLARRGMILLSKLNPETPRVWIVPGETGTPMLASTEFIALTPAQDVPVSFLYSLLASSALIARAAAMVTGTSKSHQRVQPASLMATEWPCPTAPLLAAFDAAVAPITTRIEALRLQSDTLAALRDALLPKLISGELRIRDAAMIAAGA